MNSGMPSAPAKLSCEVIHPPAGRMQVHNELFAFLSGQLGGVEGLSYQVSGPGNTGRIQIGTPFYVTVTGRCYLGGFWKFSLVPINVSSQGAGVSEHYWK